MAMSSDSILFNSRPLASGFALRATTRQVARSTDADNIRPTPEKQASRFAGQAWPEIILVALRANLKPVVLFQLYSLFILNYRSRSDAKFSPPQAD